MKASSGSGECPTVISRLAIERRPREIRKHHWRGHPAPDKECYCTISTVSGTPGQRLAPSGFSSPFPMKLDGSASGGSFPPPVPPPPFCPPCTTPPPPSA